MKKLVLVLTMVTSFFTSHAQIDVATLTDVEKKIVKVFKDTYVEKNFKDPYSFKLLKLELTPKTFSGWLMDDIIFLKSQLDKKDFKYQTEKELLDRLAKHEIELSNMSDIVKNSLRAYYVRLDCYGSNSYGAPILGKYEFNYTVESANTNPNYKPYVTKLN
jgi:hypothetical protein